MTLRRSSMPRPDPAKLRAWRERSVTAYRTQQGRTPKRLNAQSAKRRGEAAQRRAVVEATHERSGWRCEAAELVPEIACAGRLECDERVGRGVRPGAHLDASLTQSLCESHHRYKHAFPQEARRRGLRLESWEVA